MIRRGLQRNGIVAKKDTLPQINHSS